MQENPYECGVFTSKLQAGSLSHESCWVVDSSQHIVDWGLHQGVLSLPAGKVAAAMGAAVLSKAVFAQNHHVSKSEYDEYGPSYIHRKCFT